MACLKTFKLLYSPVKLWFYGLMIRARSYIGNFLFAFREYRRTAWGAVCSCHRFDPPSRP